MAGTITCRYTVSVTWVDLWPTVSQMSCSGTPLLLMIDTGGVPSLLGVLIACPLRGTWWGRVARHAGTCDRLAGGKGSMAQRTPVVGGRGARTVSHLCALS
jgi:hypothetical protein